MNLGPITDCRHCEDRIMICLVRGGAWKPFNLAMAANEPGLPDAYLPVRRNDGTVLVPLDEIAPKRLEAVRWVATRHRCAAMLRNAASRPYRLAEELGTAITELLDMWQPPAKTTEEA